MASKLSMLQGGVILLATSAHVFLFRHGTEIKVTPPLPCQIHHHPEHEGAHGLQAVNMARWSNPPCHINTHFSISTWQGGPFLLCQILDIRMGSMGIDEE